MTEPPPFPLQPIYDQMVREQEEQEEQEEQVATQWPDDETTETPSV